MSRQNKAIQKKIIAKQFTALHLQGQKGPSRTTPKHGKVHTLRELEKQKRAAMLVAEANAASGKPAKSTTGKGSKYAAKKAA